MNSRNRWLPGVVLLAGTLAARAQNQVAIEAFGPSGQIAFSKVVNATHYRVEWSSAMGGSWTSFTAAASSLDAIVSPGLGVATVAVPVLYRVVATVTNPPGMVLIPAGSFVMGNATNVFPAGEGHSYELPQHTVNVSAFYMDVYEVTKGLWDGVKAYSDANGYTYTNAGSGMALNQPVNSVDWYDTVKWCNARSQKEGLTPVYYTDVGFTMVYKTGEISPFANWAANGYRLPTEAEWEKAARGGAASTRFPFTNDANRISQAKANYWSVLRPYPPGYVYPSYDLSAGTGFYCWPFCYGVMPYTSPVGYFPPNGYGLYDMAGNVQEWCWDASYASYTNLPATDPRGPEGPSSFRTLRGGSWDQESSYARVASRNSSLATVHYSTFGFRCARGL